jgi:hypothetical protein
VESEELASIAGEVRDRLRHAIDGLDARGTRSLTISIPTATV